MRIIRSPSAPFGYFACLIGVLGGSVLLATGAWPAGAAFALLGLAIGVRGAREAVVFDGTGMLIRNLFATHRLDWSEVQDIEIGQRGSGVLNEFRLGPLAAVVTSGGRRIPLGVTRTMHQRSWTARERAEDIRRAWQSSPRRA